MKRQYHTLHSSRGARLRSLLFALLSGSILLCSCADELSSSASSRQLTFTTTVSSSWNQSTRSASSADVPQSTVTAVEGYVKPLYLHTYYTDSIATTSSNGNEAITRAVPIKASTMYESFGVSAYLYNTWDEKELMPLYFYDLTATNAGETYNLDQTYYWPGGASNMKFFAYAPKGDANYKFSEKNKVGSPSIDITIPSDVADQKDLLVAQSGEVKSNAYSTLPLTFNHALTAVRFVCGEDMEKGVVKSISLKNIESRARYFMSSQTGSEPWYRFNELKTYTQTLNQSVTGTPGEAITNDAQTFMMIPQKLNGRAELEVVFVDEKNNEYTLTANISGQVWPMGKTVNYKISTSSINWEYTLDVVGTDDFFYHGGTNRYWVTSTRKNGKGTIADAPWTTQFSTDNGVTWTDIKPSWLTSFVTSGSGGAQKSYNATVAAQTPIVSNPQNQALKDATPKGSAAVPYNLANQTNGGAKVENTANCYVVDASGYYSFPMVYGNAIKNGTTNTSAYKTTAAGNVLQTLYNHFGPITDPFITNNANCNIKSAELVWQDAKDLITDVRYVDYGVNGGYVSFKVDKNTIQQGNAVIAVKRPEGTILWSWHIWVTPDDLNKTTEITNEKGKKFYVSPLNLGWCSLGIYDYYERSCLVKFTAGGASKIMKVRQLPARFQPGYSPYYQYGRKDPFQPSNGKNSTVRTWYDKDGVSSEAYPIVKNLGSGDNLIKNCILNPNTFASSNENKYLNLWSINNGRTGINTPVVKTIYDPCPVGFKIPESDAFTGLSQENSIWNSNFAEKLFYTDASKAKTVMFKAAGVYDRDGNGIKLKNVNIVGYYRTADFCTISDPYFLWFGENAVKKLNYTSRHFGNSVCPVKE